MTVSKNIYNNDESLRQIEKTCQNWQKREVEMEAELETNGYNENTLRQLRNVKMHITTCQQRINGEWITNGTENIIIEKQ